MKLKISFLINLILIASANTETVYKTVDNEGNPVFSDIASNGAKEIPLKGVQSMPIPPSPFPDHNPIAKKEPSSQYSRLNIINPKRDSTIHSNEGNVKIDIEIEPALNKTDSIVLFLDDKQAITTTGLTFSLSNINRGAHTIAIAVKNAENKIVQHSLEHTFYVRQMSRLFPNSPTNPETAKKNKGTAPSKKTVLKP